MCASITKLDLPLSFQIIAEDVQTLLEVIKNVVKTSLHEIIQIMLYTLWDFTWTKIMFCCKNKVFVTKKENKNIDIEHENENEVMGTDEISHKTANDIVNQSLEMLECSPLKVLWSDRTSIGKKRKIKDVTTKF